MDKCSILWCLISMLGFYFWALLWVSMIHKHAGRWIWKEVYQSSSLTRQHTRIHTHKDERLNISHDIEKYPARPLWWSQRQSHTYCNAEVLTKNTFNLKTKTNLVTVPLAKINYLYKILKILKKRSLLLLWSSREGTWGTEAAPIPAGGDSWNYLRSLPQNLLF